MSRFKTLRERNITKKNDFFHFKGKILLKTTSDIIWNNQNMAQFGVYLEEIIFNWIKSIKRIQNAKNIFKEKNI
jgi:hypothetical protein